MRSPPLLSLCVLITSPLAQAHTGVDAGQHHEAFMLGLLHPLGGIDHISAAIAVGLWGALFCPRVWMAPAVFVFSMALGAVLGFAGWQPQGLEWWIASSVLVLGALLVLGRWASARVALVLLAALAGAHGLAHGGELMGASSAWQTLTGLVLSTALMHALGVLVAQRLLQQRVGLQRMLGIALGLLGATLMVLTSAGAA
jgi:urease accessory protein